MRRALQERVSAVRVLARRAHLEDGRPDRVWQGARRGAHAIRSPGHALRSAH